jgi:recombination protein RecT
MTTNNANTQKPPEQGQGNHNGSTAAGGEQTNQVIKKDLSHSERFQVAVEREFSSNAGKIVLTSFQKKLCQNYFIKIDMLLKDAERKRQATAERYREAVPFTWENVNIQKLAVDVITYSSIGLDPVQPNQVNPIPFKNKSTNKYDITFIMGFRGLELKARKYGFEVPDDVVVELVYANDNFKQIKKDSSNKVEGYTFEILNDFDRGEILGGFYYLSYTKNPEKNKIRVFSKKDIEKRKPDHAAADFWGGEKDKWEWSEEKQKNVKVGKETVEGWFDEMAWKTIYRAAYNSITIDSEKIDENYLAVIQREKDNRDFVVLKEIEEQGNKTEIGFNDDVTGPAEKPTPTADEKEQVPPADQTIATTAASQTSNNSQATLGPGF